MRDDRHDVIVVGSRIGGSTLAALLGDAGVSVLLLDRARFPSTTCSTHFFRGGGMVGVLEQLGVLDQVIGLGCPPLTREFNYTDGAEDAQEGPPQDPGDVGYCLSARREPLDWILLHRAQRSRHVRFEERTNVVDLEWRDGRVAGVKLAHGGVIRARFVVGADGRHSLVARKVDAMSEEEAPACRALYYRYVKGFAGPNGEETDGAEFSMRGDEMAYIFPSDAGLTCVAVSVNLETFGWIRQEPEARYTARIAEHRGLAPRVTAAERYGRMHGCGPERGYVRVPWGEGWALIGDAGLHQDPWSGLGIDMAGVHATFLAEAIVEAIEGDVDEEAAFTRYHARRNEHALEAFRETSSGAKDLSAVRW